MSSLADLRRLSKQLNESTDKLNQALSKAETEFKDLNIGCTAWVKEPISFGDSWTTRGERFDERYILGWDKIKSEWQIVIKKETERSGFFEGDTSCPYTEIDSFEINPAKQSSRDLRAKAVRHLDDLTKALVEEAKSVLEAVEIGEKFNANSSFGGL